MSQASNYDKAITERFEKFRKTLGLNKSAMGRSIGLGAQRYMNISLGNNSLTTMHLKVITEVYEDLNLRWLLTGQGEMLISNLDNDLDKKIYKLEVENEILMKLLKTKEGSKDE